MSTPLTRGTPIQELSFAIRNALRNGTTPDNFTLALIADRLESLHDYCKELEQELEAALERGEYHQRQAAEQFRFVKQLRQEAESGL